MKQIILYKKLITFYLNRFHILKKRERTKKAIDENEKFTAISKKRERNNDDDDNEDEKKKKP